MGSGDALILMGKAPIPGNVKTRLCPVLGPRGAAALYRCLLEDAAEEMSRLADLDRYLFFEPPDASRLFLGPPFDSFRRVPQNGRNLGERMAHALDLALSGGARHAAVVGADCPALSAARVRAALRELRMGAAAAFGPAADGGFYLAALPGPARFLFRGVDWGTRSVLASVTGKCREEGRPYALLPMESDIDTPDDLAAFGRWAEAHAVPRCPRTRTWISEFATRGGSAPSPPRGRRPRS